MLDGLPGELLVKPVTAQQTPHISGLVAKEQLKVGLIAEHDLLPVLHSPVHILVGKLKTLSLHALSQKGLVGHFPCRQLQLILADPLDGPGGDLLV